MPIEYLSPSSLGCYLKDPNEYYLRYLTKIRAPKMPQTLPMSVGSAFDAGIKSYFHKILKPKEPEGMYEKTKLFEAQVEEQNREYARPAGQHVLETYIKCGAAADLLLAFGNSLEEPRFEFEVRKTVEGVPLMGKPDLRFCCRVKDKDGIDKCVGVIYDFKVNGYCGKGNTSPKPGYVQLIDANGRRFGQHKNVSGLERVGPGIVVGYTAMEDLDHDWATQLATYGWLMGEEVGSPFIVGIQQIVADCSKGGTPVLRVATYCARVGSKFQRETMDKYKELWNRVQAGWRDEILESQAASMNAGGTEGWLASLGREQRAW